MPGGEATHRGGGTPERKGFRWGRPLFLLLVLGLAVHIILPRFGELQDAIALLERMHWWALALAVAAQVLSYWGSGRMLKALAAGAGETLSTGPGVLLTLAGGSVGLVAGGQLGAAASTTHWTKAMGISAEGALMIGWLPPLFNAVALTASAVLGVLFLLLLHKVPPGLLVTLGTILVLLVASGIAVGAALRKPEGWKSVARKWDFFRSRLLRRAPNPAGSEAAAANLHHALTHLRRKGWTGPMEGAAVNFAFDLLTLYFLFLAVGHGVTPGVLLAGYGLPLLLGRFSFLPGGVGVVESAMAGLYGALGVPATTAVSVVLAYRLLSFWLPNLAGFPAMVLLQGGSPPPGPAQSVG